MHVRDAVAGYLFALDHLDAMRGQVFNMGAARLNYTKMELARMIQTHFDFEIVESELADTDIRDFSVSFEKIAALGYDCTISVEDGIAELVKLYQFYDPNSFIRPI
jgi:nucleoside-diphosphate-sugar epimerase